MAEPNWKPEETQETEPVPGEFAVRHLIAEMFSALPPYMEKQAAFKAWLRDHERD